MWQNLKCSEISLKKIERLEYKANKLITFFDKYNQCKNPDYTVKKSKSKLNFNVSVRPGVIYSSVDAKRPTTFNSFNYEGGSATGFRFGAEMEFIMKFNRNKWAFLAEPTYQFFKAEVVERTRRPNPFLPLIPIIETDFVDMEYSSIQLPLGIRHYMFLNENSSIFINASYSLRLGSKDYTIKRSSTGNVLAEVDKKFSDFQFGIGLKYKRYFIEARYGQEQTNVSQGGWAIENNMISLILGYKIF